MGSSKLQIPIEEGLPTQHQSLHQRGERNEVLPSDGRRVRAAVGRRGPCPLSRSEGTATDLLQHVPKMKSQAPNRKSPKNPELQTPMWAHEAQVWDLDFGTWSFFGAWSLELGIW